MTRYKIQIWIETTLPPTDMDGILRGALSSIGTPTAEKQISIVKSNIKPQKDKPVYVPKAKKQV